MQLTLRRGAVLAGLVILLVLGAVDPAAAVRGGRSRGGDGNATTNGEEAILNANQNGSNGAPAAPGGGHAINAGDSCGTGVVWNFAFVEPALNAQLHEQRGTVPGAGAYVYMWCGGDVANRRIVWSSNPTPDPAVLAQQLVERHRPPSVDVEFSPNDQQLVGVDTWLWVDPDDWQDVTPPPLVLGAITVSVTFAPRWVEWDMGDGSKAIRCDGPGTPYDPDRPEAEQSTTCKHTYERSSAREPNRRYRGQATIHWAVISRVNNAEARLPSVTSTEDFTLRVAESQAVGTR